MLRAKTPDPSASGTSHPAQSRQARPGEDSRHDSMGRENSQRIAFMIRHGLNLSPTIHVVGNHLSKDSDRVRLSATTQL